MNISLKKRTKNWGLKNKAGEIIGIEKLNFFRQGSVRSPWIACRIAIRSWALSSIRDAMNGLRP